MDQGLFINLNEFDVNDVDLETAPQSAEHYLQQVIAGRDRIPSCVSVSQTLISTSTTKSDTSSTSVAVRDSRAPPRDWCRAKVAEFSLLRSKMEKAPRRLALKLLWPSMLDEEKWEELLLRRCHSKCIQFLPLFPNHRGTPPAVPVVLSLPSRKVNALITYVAEWAESDNFNRELREWMFALLLIVEKPLLPEVCAAIRGLANRCKSLRSSLEAEREDEIREFSWFITIAADYFGQTDLSDL
ncbi:hypothetical protein KIN20_016813 [Parelaphostrongylus tenuis]|uniref:Gem-associated protein 2 n=1 Tax=Parelaphostrongylus tenuis TaxID=148309 RepID=A0AAD5N2C7_PARTN|nr:hypothetical protein KIN20_016813 [Parelaphostrongylus tenuis]